MNISDILARCDHTLLAVNATEAQIKEICDDGIKFGVASVCIPPSFIKSMRSYVGGRLALCTVIGFPNGYSTAAVKAKSDICVTSSNAINIVQGLDEKEIIFIPDRNLGRKCAEACPDKQFYFIDGCCPIHDTVSEEQAKATRAAHPDAVFLVHPECQPAVSAMADFVGSTKQIIDYALKTPAKKVIVGTEKEIVAWLQKLDSTREYIPLTETFVCADMKKTTLATLKNALETEQEVITIPENLADAASRPLERMVAKG